MKVNLIDCYQFHVKDLDKEEVVNLQTEECTCKEFQAEQLPCSHAIAAAWDRNINVYSLCANYYTNENLLAVYAEAVYPVGNQMTVLSDKYFPATVSCQIPEDGNADGICFSVLGKNVCFTQEEFNIITRLWPTNTTLEKDYDNKCLQSLLFGSENKKLITCLKIEEIFKNCEFTNDDNAVKVALAVFIETVMVRKDKKTQQVYKEKKEAYELKKTTSSKAVAYYNIKDYVLAFQVWAYEVLSNASEHLATRNSKGLIPRIFRWNCTQAPSYKMLQKNIFDNKNDDNMQMEDDESIQDINNNDTNTPDHAMNNKSLEQSDSSPQLSPQRKQSQIVADQSEMHLIINKKCYRSKKSNDKEQQSHSKSYKKLKNEIKEVRKELSTLTSIVCRMDDIIRKHSLELSKMKQMLERLI
ncbi:Ulp1-like peptidase [Cucumis melo var. makuwa]|uniref:Ulp1-like peptidase n=1 Tax=Cucumis melo var. makuwa TaxID=1194695 RepID=A0A5D3D776_CUCMM|nr:Ulp1-like peptidase [Cucumis melo var. makuwa]TYK19300.1 Ulp1-like peptidase [Cucumis melo var. makuwa]